MFTTFLSSLRTTALLICSLGAVLLLPKLGATRSSERSSSREALERDSANQEHADSGLALEGDGEDPSAEHKAYLTLVVDELIKAGQYEEVAVDIGGIVELIRHPDCIVVSRPFQETPNGQAIVRNVYLRKSEYPELFDWRDN